MSVDPTNTIRKERHTSAGLPSGPRRSGLLDANYRRARRPDDLGSQQGLSTVVPGSVCASVLLYVLLYGADAKVSGHLTQRTGRAESDATDRAIAQLTCATSVLAADPGVFHSREPGRRTAREGPGM